MEEKNRVQIQIDLNKKDGLKKVWDELLVKYDVDEEEITDQLEEDEYYDAETLICEVLKQKPKEDHSLTKHWEKKVEFFKDKNIYLRRDKEGCTSGSIKQIIKGHNTLTFTLRDNHKTEIKVRKYNNNFYKVSIKKILSYPLMEAILNGYYDQGAHFYLRRNVNSPGSLPAGQYTISIPKSSSNNYNYYNDYEEHSTKKFDLKMAQDNNYGYSRARVFRLEITLDSNFKDAKLSAETVKKIKISEVNENSSQNAKYYNKRNRGWGGARWIKNKFNFFQQELTELDSISGGRILVFKREYSLEKEVNSKFHWKQQQISQNIKVIDERDGDTIKMMKEREIEKKLGSILKSLVCQKEEVYRLADILIRYGSIELKNIEKSSCYNIKKNIEDVVNSYLRDLQIIKNPIEILNHIVEEALLNTIMPKETVSETENTIALLKESHKHTKIIKQRDVVLLLGTTGSGKSTTVSYLIGEDLEMFWNAVGEQVVQKSTKRRKAKKKLIQNIEQGPKIGQSLGTSETLYAQGYELDTERKVNSKLKAEVKNTILIDCPGFEDTRSKGHKICTNLSIDQAILQSGRIKAVVVVIPFSAFTIDRGNLIFNLIQLMQQKFPTIFSYKGLHTEFAHILVTKENQSAKQTVDGFKNGTRIQKIIQEFNQQLKKLEQKDENDLHRRAIESRKSIWLLIDQLLNEGHLHFVNVLNKKDRKRRLEDFCITKNLFPKDQYKSALENDQIKELNDIIKTGFSTWKDIFVDYLKLPKEIEKITQEIVNLKTENKENEQAKTEKNNKIIELQSEMQKINQELADLKNFNQLSSERKQQIMIGLEELLEIDVAVQLKRLPKEIKETECEIKNEKEKLKNRQKCYDECKSKIVKCKKDIEDLHKKIDEKSKGKSREIVFEKKYNKNIPMKLSSYNTSSRDRAHNEFRKMTEKDYTGSRKVMPHEHVGNVTHDIIIEAKYNLVAETTTKKQNYSEFLTNHTSGTTEAKIDGHKYIIDKDAHTQGTNKVMYGFKTTWTGSSDIPWFSITHQVPNHQYYHYQLCEWASQIKRNKEECIDNQSKIVYEKNKVDELNQKIQKLKLLLTQNKDELSNAAFQAESSKGNSINDQYRKIQKAYYVKKKSVQNLQKEILKIDKDNKKNISHIKNFEKLTVENSRKVKRYAFMINKKKEIPNFLQKLVDDLFLNSNSKNMQKNFGKKQQGIASTDEIFMDFKKFCSKNWDHIMSATTIHLQTKNDENLDLISSDEDDDDYKTDDYKTDEDNNIEPDDDNKDDKFKSDNLKSNNNSDNNSDNPDLDENRKKDLKIPQYKNSDKNDESNPKGENSGDQNSDESKSGSDMQNPDPDPDKNDKHNSKDENSDKENIDNYQSGSDNKSEHSELHKKIPDDENSDNGGGGSDAKSGSDNNSNENNPKSDSDADKKSIKENSDSDNSSNDNNDSNDNEFNGKPENKPENKPEIIDDKNNDKMKNID